METNQLFEALKAKISGGITKSEIEKTLGMPQNSLSGILSGAKVLPGKWVAPLTDYVNGTFKPMEKIVIAPNQPKTENEVVKKVIETAPIQKEAQISQNKTPDPISSTSVSKTENKPVLGSNDAGNVIFDSLLSEFNKLIDGSPDPIEIKQKLISLKNKACRPKSEGNNLNANQIKAITERCDNYILGVYGKSYARG